MARGASAVAMVSDGSGPSTHHSVLGSGPSVHQFASDPSPGPDHVSRLANKETKSARVPALPRALWLVDPPFR